MTVYLIRNQINGKLYVGQTTTSLRRRFQSHVDHASRSERCSKSAIEQAFLKYGRHRFTIVVLEACETMDALNAAEKHWIEHLHTKAPRGYNIREGGGARGRHAESTRAKLRRPCRPETRARLSALAQGRAVTDAQLDALRRGRETNRPHPHGSRNPNAKLTDQQVAHIRDLYATGRYSQQQLGKLYGVQQVTVSALIRGRTWSYLFPSEY